MDASKISKHVELVADGLTFPTSLTFDSTGSLYVAESGLPFGGALPGGKIWQITPDGRRSLLIEGLKHPVNGLTFYHNYLYISEGGHSAQISRLKLDGSFTVILKDLPGPGNYHTNMLAFGPDGKLYFSQGAMTNTGIIGLDAYELGWLRRLPHAYDIPGYDIVLSGVNVETRNPLENGAGEWVQTGAFVPFGTPTEPGQQVQGQLPCVAAVMRCNPDGSNLELVAWGIRNAYGLGFLPDGRLLAIDQGADDRGSRPVGNAPDLLIEIKKGAWYGWPDFIGSDPITDSTYQPQRGPRPEFILANHHELPLPEKPFLRFPPHSAAVKFDIAPIDLPNWGGHLFVALFGDEQPMTVPAGPRSGRSVVRIDPSDWSLQPLLLEPFNRPIDVRFHPIHKTLYILDFGKFEMNSERGVVAEPKSGRIWRVDLLSLKE